MISYLRTYLWIHHTYNSMHVHTYYVFSVSTCNELLDNDCKFNLIFISLCFNGKKCHCTAQFWRNILSLSNSHTIRKNFLHFTSSLRCLQLWNSWKAPLCTVLPACLPGPVPLNDLFNFSAETRLTWLLFTLESAWQG